MRGLSVKKTPNFHAGTIDKEPGEEEEGEAEVDEEGEEEYKQEKII